MAVTPKSAATIGRLTSGTTLTIAKPANVVAGDVITIFLRSQASNSNTPDAIPPAGFSRIGHAFELNSAGRLMGTWAKVATSSEPSSYTFTVSARAIGAALVWPKKDVALQVTGKSETYRGVWDSDHPGRGFAPYGISMPSISFFVAGTETTEGGSYVPFYPPTEYEELFNVQTGSGTSGSRTALWVGMVENGGTLGPADAIGWDLVSGEAAQGLSLRWKTYIAPPLPDQHEPTFGEMTSGTSLWIDRPAAVQEGDILLAFIRSQAADQDAVPPPNWIRIGPDLDTASGGRINSVFRRVATANEDTSYLFTVGSRAVGMIQSYPQGSITTNIKGSVTDYRGTWDSSADARSTDPFSSVGTSMQFFFAGTEIIEGYSHVPRSTPAGFLPLGNHQTGSGTTGSRTALWVGSRVITGNAKSAQLAWELAAGGDAVQSFSIEYLGPLPPGTGSTFDGTGTPVQVFATTPNGAVPAEIHPIYTGFQNVAEMLATPGFTWAHRGLSDFAEESLYAYTRAVQRGHGVLEYSMGRTSDGVWVGTHDNDLNRAAGRTDLPAINQMTWAEVQQYQIVVGLGAPRPFSRVEELIDHYAASHVLMFDLKNYSWGAYLDEFLLKIAGLPKNRVIFKNIINDQGLATLVGSMGYSRWGYLYEENFNEMDIDAMQEPWDLLGLDFGASESAWNRVLAYGKPVIGHIAKTQAQYDIAMAKGASGVQSTGYAIKPRSWWNA